MRVFKFLLVCGVLLVGCNSTEEDKTTDSTEVKPVDNLEIGSTVMGVASGPMIVYVSNGISDLSGGDPFNFVLTDSLPIVDTVTVLTASGEIKTFYAFTLIGVPNNRRWETGDIEISLFLPECAGTAYVAVSVSRVNSEGVVQETTEITDVKGYNCTYRNRFIWLLPDVEWGNDREGDRLRLNVHVIDFFDPSMGANHSTRFMLGSDSTKVVTAIQIIASISSVQ